MTFRLPRPAQVDLVFDGEILAEQSSKDSPEQPFWTVVRIYKTASNRYVVEQLGHSANPAHTTKRTVTVADTPADVRTALQRYKDGRTYFTNLALDALDEAAAKVPELAEAGEERI